MKLEKGKLVTGIPLRNKLAYGLVLFFHAAMLMETI